MTDIRSVKMKFLHARLTSKLSIVLFGLVLIFSARAQGGPPGAVEEVRWEA
jgi:hypothetical protein